jgi:hypothetical protein
MKKILVALLFLFICISSRFVIADEIPNYIPDELYITEQWISLTTSYDIGTKTEKLGTIYRRLFSFLLTYDFYDAFNNKIAYARSKFFPFTVHFDVFDTNENFLGAADERLFSFFPTFDIYDREGDIKLATATMNFWGTTFYIYDPITNKEMAYMSRAFFRLKNDWAFHVSDRDLLEEKNFDPRVMMTVIAFQGDREYWENQNKKNRFKTIPQDSRALQLSDISIDQVNALLDKIDELAQQEGLGDFSKPNEQTVAVMVDELDNGYLNTYPSDISLETSEKKLTAFTDYCFNLVQSSTLSDEKKKAILFLLKARLEAVNILPSVIASTHQFSQ